MDKLRNKKLSVVLAVGLLCNIALFGAKLYVGLASGSISILTDAVNSLGDTITSVVALICFYLMQKKVENEKLGFGYGRLEYVAALLMAISISVVGVIFLFTAIDRMVLANVLNFKWLYFWITVGVIAFKIGMAVFYKKADGKLCSDVLKCAYYDSLLDIGITSMTLIGLLLTKYVQLRIDAVFGIIVSVVMIIGGIRLCRSGLLKLLGEKIDDDTHDGIIDICENQEGVEEVKWLEYHDYGVNCREIVLGAVFTNEADGDIIETIEDNIKKAVFEKYGFRTVISRVAR